MKKYILFIADFDEKDSEVKQYDTLDELIVDQDGECDECGHRKKWIDELVNSGYHKAEWWDYHLIITGDKDDD